MLLWVVLWIFLSIFHECSFHTQRFLFHEHGFRVFCISRPRTDSELAKICRNSIRKLCILEPVFDLKTLILGSLGSILHPWALFWWPGAAQGTPKLTQEEKERFFGLSPPPSGYPFRHIFDKKSRKVDSHKFVFVAGVQHQLSKENSWKTGDLAPSKCDENIVNTISDAMLPCCSKKSKKQCPGRHFGGLWCHCGVTLGAKWDARGGSSRGRNSDGKKVPAGAGRSRQEQGGGPLKTN